jgi:hypothetical protein
MDESPESARRIQELEAYAARHPDTVLIEHPRDIQKIVSRSAQARPRRTHAHTHTHTHKHMHMHNILLIV